MSLARECIADLDAMLAESGETVTLTRGRDMVPVRAFVRDYTLEELVGGIIQGDREVVLSPTDQRGIFVDEPVERNDQVTIDGRPYNIETANPVRVADTVVRINLQVRG